MGGQTRISADTPLPYFTQRNKVKVRTLGMRRSQAQKTLAQSNSFPEIMNPGPSSKQLSCRAERTLALKGLGATGLKFYRRNVPEASPSPSLDHLLHYERHRGKKQGFSRAVNNCAPRLKSPGTSSVVTAAPQAEQLFGHRGHGTPQREVVRRSGPGGGSSDCPANAHTPVGEVWATDTGVGQDRQR